MKGLEEIIKERIAGRPPEQHIDVAQRTIIEVLMTQPEVPLIGAERRIVAYALERQWLPEGELKRLYRQRYVEVIENVLFLAKQTRKTKPWAKAGKPKPKEFNRPPLEAAADLFGFPTPDALAQYFKRWRQPKKKPRP